MISRLLVGMVMLTAVAGPASAQPTAEALMQANGHEFVRLCELEGNAELCNMTLRLAEQSLGLGGLMTPDPGVELACLPEGKLPPDVLSKVLSWLKAQPTALEQNSLDAAGAALKALYPCS